MHTELEGQSLLLDDLGREMDTAESKMGSVMKKLTKVLHMSSGKISSIIFFREFQTNIIFF